MLYFKTYAHFIDCALKNKTETNKLEQCLKNKNKMKCFNSIISYINLDVSCIGNKKSYYRKKSYYKTLFLTKILF